MGLLDKENETFDQCPPALQDNKINAKNHMVAIKEYGLGPADPRQPNSPFWADKGRKWGITEGDARGRLCCNCEHFIATSQVVDWIESGPAMKLKASMLPINPKWADIESKPVAFCSLLNITCSPIRTCDEQEMGGPIDDQRVGR